MKNRIVKIIGSSLALVLMGQSGAIAADPGYYPSGPQKDVAVLQVSGGGWTRCYSANYGDQLPTLANLRTQCEGDYVLYASGSAADTSKFLLLAAGERNVVFAGTTSNRGDVYNLGSTQLSNGTYFYGQDALSVGFTKNPTVKFNEADVCVSGINGNCTATDNGTERLSWHGNFYNLGGWRIGTIENLNGSTAYFKEIWVSNGSAKATMPLIQTKPVEAKLEKNLFSCSAGNYKVGMSPVDISSVKYQLFINDTLMSSVVFDKGNNIPDSMKSTTANKIPALVSAKEALFDLTGMSSYSAYCTVDAFGFGSSAGSASTTIQDPALIAAAAAKEKAWDLERAAAVAANFSKEAREKRKRLAALANR